MGLILRFYKWRHPEVADADIPARYRISLWTAVKKPVRKWFSAVVVPTIPFNGLRVACYRLCGYKVGGVLSSVCGATSTTYAMTRLR